MYVHVNGDLVPEREATVSVRDRGFRYGDAAFETVRAYGGEVFELDAHLDRLAATCEALSLDHGLSRSDLAGRIEETLAANDLQDASARLSITRGPQPGKLTPRPVEDPTVVVTVAALPRGGVGGESVWDGPATAVIADTRRIPDEAIPASAKTHNYLNGILARIEARDAGADEAILLDGDGYLTEGATSNLFFVRDGTLFTPTLAGPVLPGITRAVVLDLADEAEIDTRDGRYAPADLREADAAFLTNSSWEIRPLSRIDGTPLDDAGSATAVVDRLASAFDERVERQYY